jgi:hypothetical protein
MKLNLGCGFKKFDGYVNADIAKECEPNVVVDLVSEKWPWEDFSVSEALIEFSLEQMGHTPKHLEHFFKELYRVCANKAKIQIKCIHPRHDQFALNPLCTQKISPEFLSLLSAANNLQKIAAGELNDSVALMWQVNFNMVRRTHFYIISSNLWLNLDK